MANEETRVTYKAVADFVSFTRAVDRAKQKLRELRKEEAALNAETVAGEGRASAARGKHTGAMSEQAKALEAVARGADKAAASTGRHSAATTAAGRASREAAADADSFASAVDRGARAASRSEGSVSKFVRGAKGITPTFRSGSNEINNFQRVASRAGAQLTKLQKNLDRLRDWRPRLVPPFIALVPVIASLLALVNPLVAGFGAIIPVAFGFASSLGTLAGAALGAAPALAGLLSTVFALKTAFGGIGGAFKAFGKTPAGGGGGGGAAKADKPIEISQTEKITRANEAYRRSVEDVQFAEEDLDDARKDYIKRVQDLQKAVDRAAASQARASANERLAQENYANVLADPGSTKGQKMDAAAGVTEAQQDYQDTLDENKSNAKELADLKKKGINGDRQVIMSQRAVTDALDAQRDAQIALQNAIKGTTDATSGGGGGASAIDEYAAALAKLSPSARKFVEALVAMKPELDKLKKTVQEAFFSQFVDDIELLRKLFPPVTSLLSDVAAAAGRVADKFLSLVTNDAWTSDIAEFGREFAPILEDIGDAFLALLDGFRNLTMAVTPFLGRVAKRFKEFSENLRDTLGAARADGSLAAYMERVAAAWDQWWRIIKNVGKTLMGYSKASSDFGQWLTDGLEKLTEGWVKNSEEAQQKGSGYKQWLEDLRPLLKEVKGLFGDFFGYLHDEATDPETIKQFTDLVKIIREDVGPALGRILDALSKSGIGEGLAKAIGAILDALADFLENGGAEGMSAFFDVIAGLAKAAGDFVSALPKPVVKYLVEGFAVLAALTFVGLNALIGNLIRLGASKGLMSILKLIPGLGKLAGGTGGKGGLAALLGVGAGTKIGASGVGKLTPGVAGSAGKGLVASLGKGGIAGIVAAVVASIGADKIRDANKGPAGDKGSGARVGANALEGAATGAGIGATIGSVVPGVGTVAGGVVGGVVGGGVGALSSDKKDIDRFNDDTNGMLEDFFTKNLPKMWDGVISAVSAWWKDTTDDWKTVGTAISAWWSGVVEDWKTAGAGISQWWSGVVEDWKTAGAGISQWWSDVVQSWKDAGAAIGQWWDGVVQNWRAIGSAIGQWWDGVVQNWRAVGSAIGSWWDGVVQNWRAIGSAIGSWWDGVVQNWRAVGAAIGQWWGGIVQNWRDAAQTAGSIWGNIQRWFGNLVNNIGTVFDRVGQFFRNLNPFGGGNGKNSGGIIRRAVGGEVPGRGSGDTVRAMLTPGEFVVRKAIVSRIGVENFQRLNSGVMSFGKMLGRAQQERPNRAGVDSNQMSFFNGGGLVPQLSGASSAKMMQVANQKAGVASNDYSMHFGDIKIYNPVAEKSSDSLPKAIRRTASLGAIRRDR